MVQGWYTASCLLRLREAKANSRGSEAEASTLWTADKDLESVHLFGATDGGWHKRPVELRACGVLRLGAVGQVGKEEGTEMNLCEEGVGQVGENVATLVQLVVDEDEEAHEGGGAGDGSRWYERLLEAAERVSISHDHHRLVVQLPAGRGEVTWREACERRGYQLEEPQAQQADPPSSSTASPGPIRLRKALQG